MRTPSVTGSTPCLVWTGPRFESWPCSRARVGVRARVHGARTHGGARSPRPDYRRGLRIPGSRRILLNSFEKRGIFGPQVRGNNAEISENSDSIRSMRIAVGRGHRIDSVRAAAASCERCARGLDRPDAWPPSRHARSMLAVPNTVAAYRRPARQSSGERYMESLLVLHVPLVLVHLSGRAPVGGTAFDSDGRGATCIHDD